MPPTIANDRKDLQRRRYPSFGLKAAGVLGIPAAVLFWSFAEEILCALYPHLVGEELAQATGLFRLMAPCALFAMAAQVTGGMLQGMGRVKRPMVHLCLGAAGKIALEAALMCDPAVHIRGAAIGSTLCYGVAALWNLADVLRLGCGEYHFLDCCAKPLACSAAMLAVMRLAYPRLLGGGARWALVGAGTLGAAVYAAGIWLCRAVRAAGLCAAGAGGLGAVLPVIRKTVPERDIFGIIPSEIVKFNIDNVRSDGLSYTR